MLKYLTTLRQVSKLNGKFLVNFVITVMSATMICLLNRLVLRTKELESKLELEHATRSRLDVQCNRHKESLEKTQTELMHIRSKETLLQEELKKIKKTLRYFTVAHLQSIAKIFF